MLPIGSIVYLKEGRVKIMIENRYPLVNLKDEKVYFDYTGSKYPEGLDPKQVIYFNKENIDTVVHEGYHDEDDERYLSIVEQKVSEGTYKKAEVTGAAK
ncbi:hypothetical protein A5866_001368 [Enterococcus sp. 12C11_DIV0727]|uniref:DUF4176 domain-containing protein n=2 Tax=Candidatus Enterococcus lemimoniae TaxID=1834167 RepID=A0ABZ2T4H9_9ENTE|nr:hypothetical protein A5866_000655 [Enterococcus sp. 12C11_DIV0727]